MFRWGRAQVRCDREEVVAYWGEDAYACGDAWWRSKTAAEQREFHEEQQAIIADFTAARAAAMDPDSARAQEVAGRHYRWLTRAWQGTPPTAEGLMELARMYVADARFAATYGGPEGAAYVRDALCAFAEEQL